MTERECRFHVKTGQSCLVHSEQVAALCTHAAQALQAERDVLYGQLADNEANLRALAELVGAENYTDIAAGVRALRAALERVLNERDAAHDAGDTLQRQVEEAERAYAALVEHMAESGPECASCDAKCAVICRECAKAELTLLRAVAEAAETLTKGGSKGWTRNWYALVDALAAWRKGQGEE
jgi:hypothetical protein